ncbi:MAG: M48 family metallopeptidase [Patescibacteria group bacterium]
MYNQIASNKRKTILLIIVFVAVIFGLAWGLAGFYGEEYYIYFPLAIIISVVMTLVSYFSSDKVALKMSAARGPVSKEENAYVYRMVENLCITAGLPLPKIYLIDSPAINAFACGRNPQHSSIALTHGAIEKLTNEELEGVIAHELSHVKNYDILVMTIIIILVGIITIVTDIFFRSQLYGRGLHRSSSNNRGGNPLMLIGFVLMILSPIIAQLIKLAISRKREFLADASGSLLTRYPEGLARALEKIRDDSNQLEKVSEATAHLFISSPLKGKTLARLFSTHPPLEERIQALRQMGNIK